MTRQLGLRAVLLLAVAVVPVRGAAPPAAPRALTAAEQKEVDPLSARLERHFSAGEFEDAARLATEVAVYRRQHQGAGHWQTRTAQLEVERLRRLTAVRPEDRSTIVRADAIQSAGGRLHGKGRYREAEVKCREALTLRLEVLGEAHPDVADTYNDLGLCLQAQDKHSEALVLHRKALAIYRKTLGEDHPDTALTYNSVASCLDAQGKHAEALPLFLKALDIRRKTLGE